MTPLVLLFSCQHDVIRYTDLTQSDWFINNCSGGSRHCPPDAAEPLFSTFSGSVCLHVRRLKQRCSVLMPSYLFPLCISKAIPAAASVCSVYTRYVFRSGEAFHASEQYDIDGVRCYQTGANHQTCLLLTEQAEAEFRSRSAGKHLKPVQPLVPRHQM